MTRRKASEITKAELVKMIARLRGVLYEVNLDETEEAADLLEETSFDDDLNETYSGSRVRGEGPKHKRKRASRTRRFRTRKEKKS